MSDTEALIKQTRLLIDRIQSQQKSIETLTEKETKITAKKTGRSKTQKRVISKSSQSGLPQGWTRATFIVKEETLEKIKDLAYTERKEIKIVVNEALEEHLRGYHLDKQFEKFLEGMLESLKRTNHYKISGKFDK